MKGNNMSSPAVVKENPDATKYVKEKYHGFLNSKTSEEALPHLWHISQLVNKLSDKHVKEIFRRARKEGDDRIHFEQRYLAGRWIGQFVLEMSLISSILLILCIVFVLVGIIYKLPSKLSVIISYILGAFSIEGAFTTLILYLKQKVVRRNGV